MATQHSNSITLDADQVSEIRRALLIGLTSYGQILECLNSAGIALQGGRPITEEMLPRDPTGCSDTVSVFATALSFID